MRLADVSAFTNIPFSNVTVTVSCSLFSVRMPVFRCSPISWKMSGSPKSLIDPCKAIGDSLLGDGRRRTAPVPPHYRHLDVEARPELVREHVQDQQQQPGRREQPRPEQRAR